ncbi:hypothetical protein AQUCO_00300662v1 [Aquilegia coerulea]|uniref:Subtilisin-like protease fibronectin type-III domain-containing protein n=1 Tax=Aquilegia coerulea TaxID=218851 RepID=A0A2G5F053_AQUCA|nr:hypothetical protein AQUCO_00300662v1 [Aquilegia coerulea]
MVEVPYTYRDNQRQLTDVDDMLQSYSKEKAKEAMIYSHTKHINAFSAMLEPQEAKNMSKHADVSSLFECNTLKSHTTRTWEFLGMEKDGVVPPDSIWKKSMGEDIIIANMDTGVDPSSESFKDDGMGPIPSKWKGHCGDNDNDGSSCNRKLISMRKFYRGYEVALNKTLDKKYLTSMDIDSHGTHTLSTAGGGFVSVNYTGFSNKTAKGGAPNARVASYKVLFGLGIQGCDELAALDEAIHDGVDVLSLSLGSDEATKYFEDGLAIGTLHALKKGIVSVMAASNSGPNESTVTNVAPWVITVGASTIDRTFTTYVELGNKQRLKVKGTIVVSPNDLNTSCVQALEEFGAAGLIFVSATKTILLSLEGTDQANIPSVSLDDDPSKAILHYIHHTKSPIAYITPVKVEINTKPAPTVGGYSSRGPNRLTPEILKPDIIAPGTYIVAAVPHLARYKNVVRYKAVTGTSMATPHVAGVVALLKAIHPDWSSAMIKSAIMTTATTIDNTNQPIKDFDGKPATPFVMGAGHIQPNNAADPGLVYDLKMKDYLNFLCVYEPNGTEKELLSGLVDKPFKCPESYNLLNFNYPSITVPKMSKSVTVRRIVTNVGTPGTYKVNLIQPEGISLTVKPKTLMFKKVGEKKSFKLILNAKEARIPKNYVFGKLVWSDGKHNVASPIVVKAA